MRTSSSDILVKLSSSTHSLWHTLTKWVLHGVKSDWTHWSGAIRPVSVQHFFWNLSLFPAKDSNVAYGGVLCCTACCYDWTFPLSLQYGTDFYILDKYPLAVRPFYTMPDPFDPVRVCLSVCLFSCLSVCLYVGLSVCMSMCVSICPSVHLCLTVCLCVCLYCIRYPHNHECLSC